MKRTELLCEEVNSLWSCNELNRPLGVRRPVLKVRKVMLPTVQFPLMAIYCIILSVQHKRRSMSVSACQVGLRRTAPLKQTKQQRWQFTPKCAQHSSSYTSGVSSMMFHWVPLCACLSLFVLIRVCAFPCLCLYIPRVNRVASSCP